MKKRIHDPCLNIFYSFLFFAQFLIQIPPLIKITQTYYFLIKLSANRNKINLSLINHGHKHPIRSSTQTNRLSNPQILLRHQWQ
jgi:hypothetical protein